MNDAADTTGAVLAAAAAMLAETAFDQISYKELGKAVGVSERTVYRHFPTRSHLLVELALWVEGRSFSPLPFITWEGFFQAVGRRFESFDARPAEAFILARAASISPLGMHQGSFFSESVTALLEDSAPQLNLRDRRRTASALCYFASAQYWARCRTGFGMSAEQTMSSFRRISGEILAVAPEGTWPQAVLQTAG